MVKRMRDHTGGKIPECAALDKFHLSAETFLRGGAEAADPRRNAVFFDHPLCRICAEERGGGNQIVSAAVS